MAGYFTPIGEQTGELTIKRSQFITYLNRAGDPEAATRYIHKIRANYPDARHVCWAYIAGAPDTTQRSMSDDGEPSGTAGRPMLAILEHSGLGEVVVAVVRYFGGVKPGPVDTNSVPLLSQKIVQSRREPRNLVGPNKR